MEIGDHAARIRYFRLSNCYCPFISSRASSFLSIADPRATAKDAAAATTRTTSVSSLTSRATLLIRAEFASMVSLDSKYVKGNKCGACHLCSHYGLPNLSRLVLSSFLSHPAFDSGYTDAATNPTCLFGLLNQASDGVPVGGALEDPTVGGDNGEGGVVTILPVVVETAPAVCEHNGVMIPVGQAYTNQCNACQCVGANLAACQTAACVEAEAVCDFKGSNYWAGEQFMDECNTCTCNAATESAGPSAACTLMACPQPLSPNQ